MNLTYKITPMLLSVKDIFRLDSNFFQTYLARKCGTYVSPRIRSIAVEPNDPENLEDYDETETESESPTLASTLPIPTITMLNTPIINKGEPPKYVGDYVDVNDIIVPPPPDDISRWDRVYYDYVAPRLEEIVMWRGQGATISQIANNLGVSPRPFVRFMDEHRELRIAMHYGKNRKRAELVNKLHQAAMGYFVEIPTQKLNRIGEVVNLTPRVYIPPSVEAIKFALANEYSERYSNKSQVEHSGDIGLRAMLEDVSDSAAKERERPLPLPGEQASDPV